MRRRKAYIVHGPHVALHAAREQIDGLIADSAAVELGLVNRDRLLEGFQRVLQGQGFRQLSSLTNTLLFDLWLRGASKCFLDIDTPTDAKSSARQNLRAERSVPAGSTCGGRTISTKRGNDNALQ
jgi:hypothetical protein